jgi:hypothetical protein
MTHAEYLAAMMNGRTLEQLQPHENSLYVVLQVLVLNKMRVLPSVLVEALNDLHLCLHPCSACGQQCRRYQPGVFLCGDDQGKLQQDMAVVIKEGDSMADCAEADGADPRDWDAVTKGLRLLLNLPARHAGH